MAANTIALVAFRIAHPYLRTMQPSPSISAAPKWSLLLFALAAGGAIAARHIGQVGLSLASDLLPFAGAVALGAVVAARLFRARVVPMLVWCMAYSIAACVLIGALGTAHLASVIAEAVQGPFEYDFRYYALIQLGLLLIVPGYWGVISASRAIAEQEPSVRQLALVWGLVLCVNVPLIPLQGFAILFSALGCIGLVALRFMLAAYQGSPTGR